MCSKLALNTMEAHLRHMLISELWRYCIYFHFTKSRDNCSPCAFNANVS